MKEQLEKRLAELKNELETGQKMLADLDAKRAELQQNMLRISGAIQVLEEELNREKNKDAEKEDNKDSETGDK